MIQRRHQVLAMAFALTTSAHALLPLHTVIRSAAPSHSSCLSTGH